MHICIHICMYVNMYDCIYVCFYVHEVVSKIFRADVVKVLKLTIRPIGHRQPRSSTLPHIDNGPTVSSIFGTLPGSHFLSDCQAPWDSACISSMILNRRSFSFNFIFGNRKKSQGAKSGEYIKWGMRAICFIARNWWVKTEVSDGALSWWRLRHCAFAIIPSEPVGMSHNQFPPPQQCREWSDVDPDGRAHEFVQHFQGLCWFYVCLRVRHRQLMCDRSWTGHAIETPIHNFKH